MKKQWKDIKVGDIMKDGSVVTQIHRTHQEECCRLTYDNDQEMICAFRHIFLVDVHNLPPEGKQELEKYCTFVPIEENYSIYCDESLSLEEKFIIEQFCNNQSIDIEVDLIQSNDSVELYDFHFKDKTKRIKLCSIITKNEPQKVDDNTYWLTCSGIKYLMDKYKVDLFCNDLILNKIESVGPLDCFCISTNTGRYET